MNDYYVYMLIGGVMSVIGMIISSTLKSKFQRYSQVGMSNGLSGAEVAQKMLNHYGIYDVKIQPHEGFLSDHYNPANKTVNLSPDVYSGRSIASAAVAAHECGHAVQHATAYKMLEFRSAIVPIVNVASMSLQYLLIGAFVLGNAFPSLMLITIGVFAITTLFSLVTLPVEFDASRRALAWLNSSGTASGPEYAGAKDALWWAAMTYVSAALSSLVMLIYLILRYTSRN